jgi:uncharacterized protein related to proFAR isomerase
MAFLEIPAISVMDKTIVLAQGSEYESLTIDDEVPDALDLIELITENYEIVYITDINALMKSDPQIKFIRSVSDFCEVWLDGGVFNCESVYDLLVAGAQEVVVSSKTMENLMELAKACDLSENIIFELDFSAGVVSPNAQLQNMTPKKLAEEIKDLGISKLIFADLDRIGKKKTLERYIIQSLIELELEVYVGGGIKFSDLSMLKKLGAYGAIIELTDILKYGKVEF